MHKQQSKFFVYLLSQGPETQSRPQSSSRRMTAREEELWGTLEQDCLWLVSAKNNKRISDWSIQVRKKEAERVACLACDRSKY